MRILDVTNPSAAEHLTNVFRTLAALGFTYHKVDFLYAGAIPGLDAYREGMRLIREAVGPAAIILACGAPILPSIGLCDAMRIGPDVLQETSDPQLDVETLMRITGLRSWMNGRLWVNDPDHLVARPDIKDREAWAAHLQGYGGQAFSSDRLATLDERGLELTRRFLRRPSAARGADDEVHGEDDPARLD
jgi:alpha-galactosidase